MFCQAIIELDDNDEDVFLFYRQIDRDKKTLARYDQQRNRDAEMLRTVTENLQRAFYTNDSISTDMKRETEKLKKEEDGIRVRSDGDFHRSVQRDLLALDKHGIHSTTNS